MSEGTNPVDGGPDAESIKAWQESISRKAKELGWKETLFSEWHWDLKNTEKTAQDLICDGITPEQFENYRDSIVWELEPGRGDTVLNIGCGLGRVEKFLAPVVKAAHAVDFSSAMVERGRDRLRHLANVHFHVNDGASLSMIASATIDLAFSELVFQHIPPEIAAAYVAEVHRVLVPGGRFIVQIPTRAKYAAMPRELCAAMDEAEVRRLFAGFSSLRFVSRYTNDFYWTPVVTK